jgi:hypothetical protein
MSTWSCLCECQSSAPSAAAAISDEGDDAEVTGHDATVATSVVLSLEPCPEHHGDRMLELVLSNKV